MTLTRIAAVLLMSIPFAGCSGNTELDEAKQKIAKLEAQLAFEKATHPAPETAKVTPKAGSKGAPQAAAAAVAIASAPAAPTGQQWNYSATADKMTGGTTYNAAVSSSNTVSFDFPYSGQQHGTLSLRIDRKYGKDVMFSIEKGQILCHSFQDCVVLVRFDDEKPTKYAAAGPADNSSDTIFIRGYDKFSAKLRKAKTVRLSVNIYQQGAPVFEFDVSGFDQEKFQPKSK
ncbi:hypothetical protein PO883_31485 [Massilia sp. DJPM01]|uniref:hypothetical protein n=1 Tax=Massilia sp. DJPM01 TaxID=3024404 RepID=UPI00259F76DE|nr:hypothetical protein [Massilia sp. DJPM01]MDM5181704.1 hypothetical protein [Massilia sp. DJPM01]